MKKNRLLLLLLALLAFGQISWAQSGNWTDDGNRAASFSSQSDNTITIMSEAEFALMAYNVNNGNDYCGTNFVLGTDLSMGTHYWTPIGNYDHPFMGNFNGNWHTINGINVNTTNDYAGLFGHVQGKVNLHHDNGLWYYEPGSEYVKNFVMTNANITGGDYTGGIVGWLRWEVTVENVFCQANVTGGDHVGGLIGREEANITYYSSWTTVTNCLLTGGKITANGSNKAALIGSVTGCTHYDNNFYLDPASAVGNSRDVRGFPVNKSISDGVTFTYNNGSTGFVHNDVLYHPAGTCNFSVAYPLTPTESISVAVNGTQLGNQVGNYQFAVSAETASYTIYVTVSPSGITGDGSVDNPYIINTAAQWDICTAAVGSGDSYNGVYFKLGNSITVSTMMGTNNDHPFSGIFDGDGKTLTIGYGSSGSYSDQECAPFYRLHNATIKNLVVAGSIYSSAQHCGGLAVKATGENNHIENCVSSVSINSNISGECINGGFIGWLNTEITRVWFKGCAFTGELLGENATDWGGFVGWRNFRGDGQQNWNHNYVTFTNCLFAPTTVNISDGGNNRTFCRSYMNYTNGASYNNCYYATVLQNVDGGRQMYSITGDVGITVANAGTVTTYSLSGITSYGVGIKYNDVLYAGNGDNVSLTLSGSANGYYTCVETALLGHENPYTLRMPSNNVVISAWNVTPPATIASVSDWNTFCTAVNGGYNYQGETVTMTANVGNISTVAGDNDHPFSGTFDGGGHTLTLAFGTSESYINQECAPFYRLHNATVKDLVVAGSIYSSAQHNAGFTVTATGSNNHIQNSVSSVSINSNISGECINGGFIAMLNTDGTHVYFNGCAFTGELLGANATNWGGFVGWREYTNDNNNHSYIDFVDCLFVPTTINIATPSGSNSRTFCRSRYNYTAGDSYNGCYFSQMLQVDDGGYQMYSITAGTGVTTLENAADAVGTYTVSRITNYGSGLGLKFNDVLYAKDGDNVSLNITGASTTGRYIANDRLLAGTSSPYTLTMGAAAAEVSAWDLVPPTEIANLSNWEDFCTAVSYGYDYVGETVTMTANVDNISTKAGTYDHPFRGTFDGGGHTLTLAFGTSESYNDMECAPFYRLHNATVKDLVVAGHIYSSAQHNAGIAARAYGNNNHIQNCVSNVSIHSNINGDCTNGGFIGLINIGDAHVYFEGCAFTGELLGENAKNWGGFVGWREYSNSTKSYTHFTNCLFAPTTVSIATPDGSNSRPFCRSYEATGAEYTNSYYTNALQGAYGGKQARSITGGTDVTVANAGTANEYNVSGITSYGTGIKYNNVLYAGNGDNVSLNLSYSGALDPYGYLASAGTLSGTANPFTLVMPNEDVAINAREGITREITGYGNSESVGWAFIASPVNGSIAPTAVGNIFDASEYDLYRLNPTTVKWENYKEHEGNAAAGFSLLNGRGYLYATKETKTLVFTGAYNSGTSKEITGLPAGFNLVGNPFIVDAYVNKPYYTLNGDGSAIVAEEVSKTVAIPPCYGVIVEVDETGSVTFNTTGEFSAGPNNGGLNIVLTQVPEPVERPARDNGGVSTGSTTLALDNAIITFNEGSELGKFYFGEQSANIYLPQNGKEYAIAYSEGVGEMPLNFKAKQNGEYSLSITPDGADFAYLHLIDNMTGADIDILAGASTGSATYTFTAKTTDYASRFRLVFVTHNEDGPSAGSGAFAFIDASGNLIVTGEGTVQVIDAMGRVVLSGDAKHCVSTSGMPAGVYVLRLINGDDVKTQKIVVR